ncbi:unnamed protein product [Adineta ricciae]|uniref:Selenoprotein F n=1 Tax=Adineta ricciae TaxID=249248 RepID=A0A813QML2_ADIRI|nr:unnamed protein product [Adineta ricciae]
MRTADFLAAFLSQFLACIVLATAESLSEGQCSDLGFASNNLVCSSCNDLKQFKLNELEGQCRQCCTNDEDEGEGKTKYHRAVLQISAFIRSDRPARFPSFSVQYVRGADPILNLFNDRDEQIESMGIEKWDTDTLTAFLEENLAH